MLASLVLLARVKQAGRTIPLVHLQSAVWISERHSLPPWSLLKMILSSAGLVLLQLLGVVLGDQKLVVYRTYGLGLAVCNLVVGGVELEPLVVQRDVIRALSLAELFYLLSCCSILIFVAVG